MSTQLSLRAQQSCSADKCYPSRAAKRACPPALNPPTSKATK